MHFLAFYFILLDKSKLCKSYIFEAYTFMTDMDSDESPNLEGEMKDNYCRSYKRLKDLLPEIKNLMNSNKLNSLDKWFKNYYPDAKKSK